MRKYNEAAIKGIIYEIPQIEFRKIYISELHRSRDTAERLFPNKDLTERRLINEVPHRSSCNTKRKLSLWIWNVLGRIQWFFNSSRQAEGISETRQRARCFVRMIVEEDKDCVVVTHRFFMVTLLQEMRKKGFKTDKTLAKYKNGEYVMASI